MVSFVLWQTYWIFARILPESPRWLATHNHQADAKKVIIKIAEKNNVPVPNLNFIDKFGRVYDGESTKIKQMTYIDLFRNRHIAARSAILFVLW